MGQLRDYIFSILPTWMSHDASKAMLTGLTDESDGVVSDALSAATYSRLNQTPNDGLNAWGHNSNLPRVHNETDDDFRAWLLQRWELWKLSGTVQGLLLQLTHADFPGCTITTKLDLFLHGAKNAFGNYWGYFYVTVPVAAGFTPPAIWDDPGIVDTNTPGSAWRRIRSAHGTLFTNTASSRCAFGDWLCTTSAPQQLLHWNGLYFESFPHPSLQPFTSMWGIREDNLWASAQHPNDTTKVDWWHWNGSTWAVIETTAAAFIGAGMWGFAHDNIWCVGTAASPQIYHYDGANWTAATMPMGVTGFLFAIWGSAANDIWAVGYGEGGVMLHYDGANWNVATSPWGMTIVSLNSVWGSTSNDVWFVGSDNNIPSASVIDHWDGAAHTITTHPSIDAFYSVRSLAANDVWAMGDKTTATTKVTVEHWDGASWTSVFTGETTTFADAMVLRSDGTLVVVGSQAVVSTNIDYLLQYSKDWESATGDLWDGTNDLLWDLNEPYVGALADLISIIRKFKPSGTSCRFLLVQFSDGTSTIVPVGDWWETDANGNVSGPYLTSY